MNWLDAVLLLILLVSVFFGMKKGIARTVIGLASIVAAVLCAMWSYGMVASWLPFSSQHVNNFLGFTLVFLGVMLLGTAIAWVVGRVLKIVHLTWLDRLIGGAFGAARGILVGAVVVLAAMAFTTQSPPGSVAGSRIAPYVIQAARAMAAAAPHDVQKTFHSSYDKVRKSWSGATTRPGTM